MRQEAAVAKRAAEEARAQLASEGERARSAVRAEQEQAALMQKLEQFNLLRESNATLRRVRQHPRGEDGRRCSPAPPAPSRAAWPCPNAVHPSLLQI